MSGQVDPAGRPQPPPAGGEANAATVVAIGFVVAGWALYVFLGPVAVFLTWYGDCFDEPCPVPGTIDQHPNWRRKLPRATAALFADPGFNHLLAAVAAEREAPLAALPRESEHRALRATYRLQLTSAFGFDAATALLPYLSDLGISHATFHRGPRRQLPVVQISDRRLGVRRSDYEAWKASRVITARAA